MSKKKTLEDIFNDDEFGILDSKPKESNVKTEDERLIESFQEINTFFEKNNREPEATNVTEFKLLSRLKALRKDSKKVEILKPYDTHNLLNTKEEIKSVADILNDDALGILDTEETLSIFKLKNVPSSTDRAESDFTARRKAMKDSEFMSYEAQFKKVHKELREGKRKLKEFKDVEKNLENGTVSNMFYRSLAKALYNNGSIVSDTDKDSEDELFKNANIVNEEDVQTGWIYILKSKSTHKDIATIKDLHKIGYSTVPVPERIKNAVKEPTYLFADVKIIDAYKTYNMNTQKFELLIHRFFAEVCLNIDINDDKGRRMTPREWFVVPLPIIQKAFSLLESGEIINFKYDSSNKTLIKREV